MAFTTVIPSASVRRLFILRAARRFSCTSVLQSQGLHPTLARAGAAFDSENHGSSTNKQHTVSDILTDKFHRPHNYLRISITERCNLRCMYCMPEEGVPLSPSDKLLTSPEIFYLSSLFVKQGVTKIRLTGGEPTIRPDVVPLMEQIGTLRSAGLRELCITTNGITLGRKLERLAKAGLTGVNLSLDTLDPFQFQIMTRRNGFEAVMKTMDRILDMNLLGAGIKLKVNCVVMQGVNHEQIIEFVEMTRTKDLEVRFIEYMPFEGNKWSRRKMLGYLQMLDMIRTRYPDIAKVQDHPNDTSRTYGIPGFKGRVGFITSMTHNFCGSCNRLRITCDGNLKVCLFGNSEVSLRDIVRENSVASTKNEGGIVIDTASSLDITHPEVTEEKLLHIIGQAVKRKKAKHAGIDTLPSLTKRPMILIASPSARPSVPLVNKLSPVASYAPMLLFAKPGVPGSFISRLFSTSKVSGGADSRRKSSAMKLPHISPGGYPYMVSIENKAATARLAVAEGMVFFGCEGPYDQIKNLSTRKGDVLSMARLAGIMAAKRTPDLVPLCHPIVLTGVEVEAELAAPSLTDSTPNSTPVNFNAVPEYGGVRLKATVTCYGPTGVEMEALTAVMGAALTIVDMIKAVDRGVRIASIFISRKEGGRSGTWVDGKPETGSERNS